MNTHPEPPPTNDLQPHSTGLGVGLDTDLGTAVGGAVITVTAAPELPTDLVAGLRRLKLSTIRQLAPELLLTAKARRWTPMKPFGP